QHNLERFEDALIGRWNLFEFIRSANEHEFIARIVNLFARRSDTANFPELIAEAERLDAIDQKICSDLKERVAAVDGVFKKLRMIRHKVVSHQDATLTKPQVYDLVRPNLPMLMEFSDRSIEIASALCAARGLQAQANFAAPVTQLEEMLAELQRNQRLERDTPYQ
ncbi:MAG: hypothetical protein ACOYOH_25075, partial [Paracraurococcus sp.]